MLEPRFCYRISAEAGWAYDEDGNSAPCYTQINLEGGRKIDKELYDELHASFVDQLSSQLSLKIEYFELISQEEYDFNHKEE